MTIKELEESLGMTRANIRFYEQEGFLTPERGANNYRIYSQADAETLRKIKLLRQLGLPLETIRQVQRGEQSLDAALASQQRALEAQKAELAWAERVCTTMRSDGAEYATLDAQKYLDELDRPAQAEGYFSLQKDSAPMVAYPWRRYFARSLDFALVRLLWTAVGLLVLRFNPPDNLLITLLGLYRDYLTVLVLEPILLHTWGYTPGKWIFGLQVRDLDGGKLRWSDAMARTWLVFAKGEGYGIPFYSFYRNYKSYIACSDFQVLPWEEESRYTLKDERMLRCVGFVGAMAAVIGVAVLVMLQAYMPRNHGVLTAEQYVANVNDLYRFIGGSSSMYLAEDGRWMEEERSGQYVINLSGPPPEQHFTVNEAGQLTGVTLVAERTGEMLVSSPVFQQQLAAISFAAACGGYNCLTWQGSGVLSAIEEQPFEDYTIQAGKVTITQQVEYEGYAYAGDYLFSADEEGAQACSYRMEFTMKLEP